MYTQKNNKKAYIGQIGIWGLVKSLAVLLVVVAAAQAQKPENIAVSKVSQPETKCTVKAITRPNFDAILSFSVPGIIEKVAAKVGQKVKKGQLLAELNDNVEKAQLEQLKLDADNTIRIDASKADLKQKEVDLARIEDVRKRANAASAFEVEHARLDVEIQKLTLKLSVIQLKQAKLKCTEMEDRINQMKIKSPCDGVIETRFVEPGEAATAQTKVFRVVNIDPLWIEAPVPTKVAKKLKVGATADVISQDSFGADIKKETKKPLKGKITHIASVADSASQTMTVRVEVANPTQQPAGQRVKVCFSIKK